MERPGRAVTLPRRMEAPPIFPACPPIGKHQSHRSDQGIELWVTGFSPLDRSVQFGLARLSTPRPPPPFARQRKAGSRS